MNRKHLPRYLTGGVSHEVILYKAQGGGLGKDEHHHRKSHGPRTKSSDSGSPRIRAICFNPMRL